MAEAVSIAGTEASTGANAGGGTGRRLLDGERTFYAVGGGKRALLALAFLCLLPFVISVPVMIYQRLADGLVFDIWALAFFGLCLAAILVLLALQLMYAVRSRVVLGERAFTFTLPRGHGPAPTLHYARQTLGYAEIAEVELRREVFGGSVMPVILQGAHIITKKGIDIPLGYVSETNADNDFPFATIAHQIAGRANVPLLEEPGLWRTLHNKHQAAAAGLIAGDSQVVEAAEMARLNRNHRRFGLAIVNVVVALLLVGIAMDVTGAHRPPVAAPVVQVQPQAN